MIAIFFVPEKLDRCVNKVKAKGDVDNPWAVCNASMGKETKIKESAGDNEFLVKGKPNNTRPNANRQVPVANPPITDRTNKPQNQKTTKGIGGQVGKIDSKSNTNNMDTALWKKILDSQLKRNVKEPRI